MPKIFVGSGMNPGYLPKAQGYGYLQGLNKLWTLDGRVQPFCVLLDFGESMIDTLEWEFPNIDFIRMSAAEVRAPNSNGCLQHGVFIDRLSDELSVCDKDYVFFTDADGRMQRRFTDEEIDVLTYLDPR